MTHSEQHLEHGVHSWMNEGKDRAAHMCRHQLGLMGHVARCHRPGEDQSRGKEHLCLPGFFPSQLLFLFSHPQPLTPHSASAPRGLGSRILAFRDGRVARGLKIFLLKLPDSVPGTQGSRKCGDLFKVPQLYGGQVRELERAREKGGRSTEGGAGFPLFSFWRIRV